VHLGYSTRRTRTARIDEPRGAAGGAQVPAGDDRCHERRERVERTAIVVCPECKRQSVADTCRFCKGCACSPGFRTRSSRSRPTLAFADGSPPIAMPHSQGSRSTIASGRR
jgi:hypothetical protein